MTDEVKIYLSLATAGSSVLIAIFSFLISKKAKSMILLAEEGEKRTEQIRLKATEYGDKIIKEISNIIISAQSLDFKIKHGENINLLTDKSFLDFKDSTVRLNHLNFEAAIYTTHKLGQKY